MDALARRGARIVPSAVSSILIYGESGTGKEVVADVFADIVGKAVPFLRVNCGAISPTLLESELFGHMRGAFTGAISDRRGFFEAASGGWVFLDEVATLTASAQVALLRVLENHEVVRLGSSKPVRVDVRIIAATNEKLDQLVGAGRFRKDLWQRLREVEIELPALRERRGEIPGLVHHFCKVMPGGPYEVTETVMDILAAAPWSDGNVRELRNCLRAMTEFATPDRRLTPLSLPKWMWSDDGKDDQEVDLKAMDLIEGGASLVEGCRSMQIDIPAAVANPYQYDDICDLALIALVRRIFRERGKVSLRSLSRLIGLSRGTITLKLRASVDKNLVGIDEIQSLFAMQAKDE
jgi:DNA-binding NtrC family response regulator